jgi:hypothetical protein
MTQVGTTYQVTVTTSSHRSSVVAELPRQPLVLRRTPRGRLLGSLLRRQFPTECLDFVLQRFNALSETPVISLTAFDTTPCADHGPPKCKWIGQRSDDTH